MQRHQIHSFLTSIVPPYTGRGGGQRGGGSVDGGGVEGFRGGGVVLPGCTDPRAPKGRRQHSLLPRHAPHK
ncbi:hypothetical protein E2C01_072097 [Portunus trituberculatus]|uniref:Uncharacterized protein n=1 Tax=Portunus trituberculatus TaxID=210409 RepID=A0A5B7I6X1_PORTR|nr:hypothetical protein [Portunus trituberculatus]